MTQTQLLDKPDTLTARRELGLQLFAQGTSVAEVQRLTGASKDTVKSWRRRARAVKDAEAHSPQASDIPAILTGLLLMTEPDTAETDIPENDSTDDYYRSKFLGNGEVRPDWNYRAWMLEQVADIKPFGSGKCTSATRPRRHK